MTEIIIALMGAFGAALAVFCYRLGLRDGMRSKRGVEPVLTPRKPKATPPGEQKAREIAEAVNSYK